MVVDLLMSVDATVDERVLSMAINSAGGPATYEIAKQIRDRARYYAPQGETGNLRRSIKAEKVGKMESKVYADPSIAPYAIFVEYGTRKMEPHAFMRRAIDEIFHSGRGRSIMRDMIRHDMDLGKQLVGSDIFGSNKFGKSSALQEFESKGTPVLSGQFTDTFSNLKISSGFGL